jgi:hypothetical protein
MAHPRGHCRRPYGLAGVGHLLRGERNFAENAALVSDFFIFVVLAVFAAGRGF